MDRLRLAPMRIVTPAIDHAPATLERISLATLIGCYRDRLDARKAGVLRVGDLDVLRRQAEMYRRDCDELWALIAELDQLEARHV